jgi:ankyrin repeat protein
MTSSILIIPYFLFLRYTNEKETNKMPKTIYTEEQRKDGLQLISASEKGDIEAVKSLLKKGAFIHAQDREGRCPLVAAAYKNHLEIADLLIAAGADINMKDDTIQNAYLISTMESYGYIDLLRKNLKSGGNVLGTDSDNGTGLIRASDRGHVEIVKELLKTDIRVNHVNRMGWTALFEAILLGGGDEHHTEIVRLLVDAGADVYRPDKDGVTPLTHAKNKNFTGIIEILGNSKAIYTEQQRKDGLQLVSASEKGDVKTVETLLKNGAYIHTQDREGRCALVAAAYKNNLEMVDLLIAAGADVNMKDDTLQSAYLISTSDGFTELLKKTLNAGADVHCTDSYNGTGLIRAADRGHVEIIKELLRTDIRVNHINRIGWTALQEAVILGDGGKRHTEVVRMLVDAGADVNLPDKDGGTPLAHAKNKNFTDIKKILEEAGAK